MSDAHPVLGGARCGGTGANVRFWPIAVIGQGQRRRPAPAKACRSGGADVRYTPRAISGLSDPGAQVKSDDPGELKLRRCQVDPLRTRFTPRQEIELAGRSAKHMFAISINGTHGLAQDPDIRNVTAMNVIDNLVLAMIEHEKLITHRAAYA